MKKHSNGNFDEMDFNKYFDAQSKVISNQQLLSKS